MKMHENIVIDNELRNLEITGVDQDENLFGIHVQRSVEPFTFDLLRYSIVRRHWNLLSVITLRRDRDNSEGEVDREWSHTLNRTGDQIGVYLESHGVEESWITFAVIILRSCGDKDKGPITKEFRFCSDGGFTDICWPCMFVVDCSCTADTVCTKSVTTDQYHPAWNSNKTSAMSSYGGNGQRKNHWIVCGRSQFGIKLYLVDNIDSFTRSFELQLITEVNIPIDRGVDVESIGPFIFFQTHNSSGTLQRFQFCQKHLKTVTVLANLMTPDLNLPSTKRRKTGDRRYLRVLRPLKIDNSSVLVSAANRIYCANPNKLFLELRGHCGAGWSEDVLTAGGGGNVFDVSSMAASASFDVSCASNNHHQISSCIYQAHESAAVPGLNTTAVSSSNSQEKQPCNSCDPQLNCYWIETGLRVQHNEQRSLADATGKHKPCSSSGAASSSTSGASAASTTRHSIWKLSKDVVPCIGSQCAVYMKLEGKESSTSSDGILREEDVQKLSVVFVSVPKLEWLCVKQLVRKAPALNDMSKVDLLALTIPAPVIEKYWN